MQQSPPKGGLPRRRCHFSVSKNEVWGFPGRSLVKNLRANEGDECSLPLLGQSPWRREWQPTLVFLWASQVAQLVKNLPANAGDKRDAGLIPVSGRSPGQGNGSPLQCSCLENPVEKGAWWATVRGVKKSQTKLSN